MFGGSLEKQLIVISDEDRNIPEEASAINELFHDGMDRFHLRKKTWFKSDISALLDEIDSTFYPRIILHSQPDLVEEYNLGGFHFNKDFPYVEKWAQKLKESQKTISISSHSICDMGDYELEVDYQFVSPVFNSISKPNYMQRIEIEKVKNYLLLKPKSKFIALGGIEPSNVNEAIALGFDGVASLGWIWSDSKIESIIKNFKSIEEAVKSVNASLKVKALYVRDK